MSEKLPLKKPVVGVTRVNLVVVPASTMSLFFRSTERLTLGAGAIGEGLFRTERPPSLKISLALPGPVRPRIKFVPTGAT